MTKTLLAAAAAAGLFAANPAQAQLFFTEPTLERGPIEATDPIVGLPLPGATETEARAGLMWNLRVGLNVAALACQFSKYLRTVDNYNSVIAHHSGELAKAYETLGSYFKRVHGAREGQRQLDAWNTDSYQNYPTPPSQAFCQTASNVAKEALTRRKGEFHQLAAERMREIRSSLRSHSDRIHTGFAPLPPLPQALFVPVCTGLAGPALQQCLAGGTAAQTTR